MSTTLSFESCVGEIDRLRIYYIAPSQLKQKIWYREWAVDGGWHARKAGLPLILCRQRNSRVFIANFRRRRRFSRVMQTHISIVPRIIQGLAAIDAITATDARDHIDDLEAYRRQLREDRIAGDRRYDLNRIEIYLKKYNCELTESQRCMVLGAAVPIVQTGRSLRRVKIQSG